MEGLVALVLMPWPPVVRDVCAVCGEPPAIRNQSRH